jgi:hypothetical protein
MAIKPITFDRLTKGQFDSVESSDVPSGGWSQSINVIPYNERMNRRDGSQPFSLNAWPFVTNPSTVVPVSDLVNAPTGHTDWTLVTITREGEVALCNPAGSWEGSVITSGSGAFVPDDEMPWRCIVRNGRVYAVRRGGGTMRRIEGGVWRDAGRPAPVASPTLGQTADGSSNLATATYKVAYGYYDSQTGYYGNPGPTAEIAVTSGNRIDVSNLAGKSTSYFADKIAIWCSQPNGEALFLSGDVSAPDAPATTTATILDDPAGQAAPTRNGQPDANVTWVEEWGERFWWAKDSRLVYSPVGEFESYSEIQAFDFEQGSGSDISVVYAWGNRLVIGKRRKMFLFAGHDRSAWEKRPWSTKLGCLAPFSMRNCEGQLIFKCEDGFAISKDGEEPQVITSDTVNLALDSLDRTKEDLIYAEVFPRYSLYIAVFPKTGGKWGGLVYNWKQRAWAEISFPAEPRSLRLGYDDDGETRLFAVPNSGTQIYTLFEGNTDNGTEIEASLLSGAPKLNEPGFLSAIHHITILAAASRWPIKVEIFGDGDTTEAIAETEVSTEDDKSWKRIAIDNVDDPRLQLQVKLTYNGKDPWWISEWVWHVHQTKKHLGEF